MTIDRSTLPDISENIKQFWQPRRKDYSSGGIAYYNRPSTNASPVSQVNLTPPTRAELNNYLPPASGLNHHSFLALISTHHGQRWQLPKGTVEPQESSIQTALREVEEETGLLTEFKSFIETVEYWYWDTYKRTVPMLVHKQVDFYLLAVVGGELSDLSFEVDAVAWFTPEEALRKMTFEAERKTLRKALNGQYQNQRH